MESSRLFRLTRGDVCGGVVTMNNFVIQTAPIFRCLMYKNLEYVLEWCRENGTFIEEVKESSNEEDIHKD